MNLKPEEAKDHCCKRGIFHPLVKLFDINVIGTDGPHFLREQIELGQRKGLKYGNEAKPCTRMHLHTQEEAHATTKVHPSRKDRT
jgi:phosphoribosyl-dephospho-CoA transferase